MQPDGRWSGRGDRPTRTQRTLAAENSVNVAIPRTRRIVEPLLRGASPTNVLRRAV